VLDYYKISDVCLVPLRKASLFTRNIPSKIYEIMASARPILIGTNGESRKLVEDAHAGIAFEPENVDELVRSISTLYENRELARRMGRSGYAYASRNCRRDDIAADYLTHLSRIAGLNNAG
jgi:colanic acid biosynthesis glycosyl transferase WcaI